MITIVLVQNDVRVKDELNTLISTQKDMLIQDMGNDGYDAIMLAKKLKPDIILLDAALGNTGKMEIISTLKRYSPASAIVIFSNGVKDYLIQGIANGTITDCLLKDSDMVRLDIILREIYRGKHYVNPQLTDRALQILAGFYQGKNVDNEHCQKKKEVFSTDFSNTELYIMRYLSEGYTSKEIAKILFLKVGTVRNYISSIMQKAGVKSRTQIVLYTQEYGLGKEGIVNQA